MNGNLNHLVRQYTIKHERTIKQICAPLQYLDISAVGYAIIKSDGSFCNINSFPAFLEYYYSEEMYHEQPYFSHPDLFQSGYTLVPCTYNSLFQKKCETKYDVNHAICKLQKHREYMEIFFFHPPVDKSKNCVKYLNNIHLLEKFTSYFKQESKAIIKNAMDEGYNLLNTRGNAFYKVPSSLKLLSNDLKIQQFLKKISPLTVREHQCLDLFREGRSAQATAAILGLSKRTVEHYFDNIKRKLGCYSKMELLER